MPKPVPIEVRERAVAAYERGVDGYEAVAERFAVSRRSLQRWVALKRDSGSVEPAPPGGGNFSPVDMRMLRSLVEATPDATSYELSAEYNRRAPKEARVHRSSIVRALERAGYVFKKNGHGRRSRTARM
jgi:transposase